MDLDIVKRYHHAKNEVSRSMCSKVIVHTDRQDDRHTGPYSCDRVSMTAYMGRIANQGKIPKWLSFKNYKSESRNI